MSNLKNIRDEFGEGREVERLPQCPPLSPGQISEITQKVFIQSNPQKADLILVFGCSQINGWPLVAELFKQGFAPRVLVTGGISKDGRILSHVIRDDLVRYGVPKECILIDEKSTNTLEDVLFARAIIEKRGLLHKRILFAVKDPHSGRCLRTLQKILPDSELFPFAYQYTKDGCTVSAKKWHETEFGRSHVWGEYQRIKLYSSRGDICT